MRILLVYGATEGHTRYLSNSIADTLRKDGQEVTLCENFLPWRSPFPRAFRDERRTNIKLRDTAGFCSFPQFPCLPVDSRRMFLLNYRPTYVPLTGLASIVGDALKVWSCEMP